MIASERFARAVNRVTLASALVAVLCIAAAIALTLLGRPGASVEQVQVTDDASVVDPIRLEEEIGALSTYAPVRVVVWTRDGEASDNINAEALDWARAQPEKELLSPDSRKWADGLLLLVLSVEQDDVVGSGEIATHFGEDVKIEPTSAQKALQERGYDDFRSRNWEADLLAIADGAAQEMARPAWTRPAVTLVIPGILALLALANAAGVQVLRGRFETVADDFTRSTADVHAAVSETEFILEHGFGAKVRSTAGSVLRQYDRTLDERDAIADTPAWRVNAANWLLWRRIGDLAESTEDIGGSTALLRRASTLYSADSAWEQVWADEVEETANHLRTALQDGGITRHASAQAAAELRAFSTRALAELEEIRVRGTEDCGESIEEGLERIAAIRAELSRRMQEIEQSARPANSSHARYVDTAIWKERRMRNARTRSITGFYDRPSFYNPAAFAIGYSSGTQKHRAAERARESARSSSGSNRSFGSSGGGFSGSGSSSRF